MNVQGGDRSRWSTRKRDDAPKGLFRHQAGGWGIRYVCGAGHIHQEQASPNKTDALRALHARRGRVHDEPGWCPRAERRQARERVRAEQERETRRITFSAYATGYLTWAKLHHRGYPTEAGRVEAMRAAFGEQKLDQITAADVERFLDGLLATRAPATRNRYRTTLHATFCVYRRS